MPKASEMSSTEPNDVESVWSSSRSHVHPNVVTTVKHPFPPKIHRGGDPEYPWPLCRAHKEHRYNTFVTTDQPVNCYECVREIIIPILSTWPGDTAVHAARSDREYYPRCHQPVDEDDHFQYASGPIDCPACLALCEQ